MFLPDNGGAVRKTLVRLYLSMFLSDNGGAVRKTLVRLYLSMFLSDNGGAVRKTLVRLYLSMFLSDNGEAVRKTLEQAAGLVEDALMEVDQVSKTLLAQMDLVFVLYLLLYILILCKNAFVAVVF